ncbi:MAG: hypothetical protein HQ522_16135 [Bacteroidetes bacterium]|nr:hypothetical protein [Bacteroidota bacterium]
MDNNYVEKTGDNTIAIHTDVVMAEHVYDGICKTVAEFPYPCPINLKDDRRKLVKLKNEIETLLPPQKQAG